MKPTLNYFKLIFQNKTLTHKIRAFSRIFLLFLVYFPLVLIIVCFATVWLFSYDYLENSISINEAKLLMFDFIIIGGGTAASVLANRLSSNENISVLMIEAGNRFGLLSQIPLLATQLQKTENDWQFSTTSQAYSSKGCINQKQFLPRGKGLGGSSQMNYMLHFDDSQNDFSGWKKSGIVDFDIQQINRYLKGISSEIDEDINCGTDHKTVFKQTAFRTDDAKYCTKNHETESKPTHSYLHITPITYDYSILSSTFVDAALQIEKDNKNLSHFLAKYTTYKGFRHSTYQTFLKPIFKRKNLKILMNTRVHKILFKNNIATTVVVSTEKNLASTETIHTKNEIILSAGVFHSPQILKLSGIGPKQELKRYRIKLVHDSPKVGMNLHDHLNFPLYITVNESMSIIRDKVLNLWEIKKYLFEGKGLFSNFGVVGYLNDVNNNYGIGIFGAGTIDEKFLRKIVNYKVEVFRKSFPHYPNGSQEGFVVLNTCNQPKSRGDVRLKSNLTEDLPIINPKYLHKDEDIACMIRAIRLAVDLLQTRHFQKVGAKIWWPKFNQCRNFEPTLNDFQTNYPSDRFLECIIRTAAVTAHHAGGTCSIGANVDDVLDMKMRVRGVKKLRVIDASILPTPISGTPHASLIAIAHYGADLILNDYNGKYFE